MLKKKNKYVKTKILVLIHISISNTLHVVLTQEVHTVQQVFNPKRNNVRYVNTEEHH